MLYGEDLCAEQPHQVMNDGAADFDVNVSKSQEYILNKVSLIKNT